MEPTPDQIKQWKQTFGKIYSIEDRGILYVFRALTLGEEEGFASEKYESSVDAEDEVVKAALLFPENIEKAPAGIVSSLAEEIVEASQFHSPRMMQQVMSKARESMTHSVPGLMKAFILATMPAYKPNELEDMNFEQLAERVALAETIIQVQQASMGMEGAETLLDIVDPEEEMRKAEQKATREKDRIEKALAKMGKTGQIPVTDESGPVLRPTIKGDDPIARKLSGGG